MTKRRIRFIHLKIVEDDQHNAQELIKSSILDD